LIFTQGTKQEQKQLNEFFQNISPSLKEKVSILIFSKDIQMNKGLLKVFLNKREQIQKDMQLTIELDDIISIMIQKFKPDFMQPESIIVNQFEDTHDMYLVSKGACLVTLIDEKNNEQIIKELRPGEYFGEIALIYGCKRTATVQSLKYSTLAKLKKSDYQDILIEFPDLKK